jgi:hypothetical protein
LEWQVFILSRRSNPIALAMMNYVQAVETTFGLTPDWDGIGDFLESQWSDEIEEN